MTHPRFPPPPRRLPAPAPPPRRCWSSPGSSCPTRLRFARRTYVLPPSRFLSLPPLPRCWLRPRSLKPLTTAGIVVPAPSPLLPSSPSLSLSLSLLLSLLTTCRLRLCLHCRPPCPLRSLVVCPALARSPPVVCAHSPVSPPPLAPAPAPSLHQSTWCVQRTLRCVVSLHALSPPHSLAHPTPPPHYLLLSLCRRLASGPLMQSANLRRIWLLATHISAL